MTNGTPAKAASKALAPRRAKLRAAPHETAAEVMAGFAPGGRLAVLTKGQFSLLDLIRALLDITGPARVRLSTWSTGIRDAESAAWLLETAQITSLTLLTDRSFPARQPAYAARLVDLFGAAAIVCTQVHAKIALIENEDWSVVVRSSMNLNRNPRFEQADVDDDRELAKWFGEWFEELAALAPHGFDFSHAEQAAAFDAAMRAGPAGNAAAVAAMTGLPEPEPAVERRTPWGRTERWRT